MQSLIGWINSKDEKELHPVIVCAVLHHRFVSIHPFTDGNGRLARILGTWILYKRGFDTNHIFNLDDFFAGDRKRYYQKIEQARELDNNLTYWIEYIAEGIVKTLKDVKKRLEDLQISSKTQIYLTPRQEEMLRILRDNPPSGIADLKKVLKLTRARLNQILAPLVKNRIVLKEGKSRATRYFIK
jgi:Fic family protein